MKKLYPILAALLLISPAAALADDGPQQTLTINGETVEKAVATITFDGDNVVLHFADGSDQTADMESVHLAIVPGTDGIGLIKMPVGDRLNIEGLAPGTHVTLYDASGRIVLNATAAEAHTQLQVSQLRSGIYMMKAGNQTVKFHKH